MFKTFNIIEDTTISTVLLPITLGTLVLTI